MDPVDRAPPDPLDSLTAVERELLILLGRGHTAKTIATLKGLSVPAVNERFRAARRKTGLGSSREIARRLTAQENRHDLIALASGPVAPSDLRLPDAPPPHRASLARRWRLPMIAAGLLIVALIAQQTAEQPAPEASPAPPETTAAGANLASEILARMSVDAKTGFMHVEVARGPRDPAWSDAAGNALLQRYRQVPGFENSISLFSLDCAATLCEAAGLTRPDLSTDDVTALMSELMTLGHSERVPGLQQVGHQFAASANPVEGFAFVSYWRRRD